MSKAIIAAGLLSLGMLVNPVFADDFGTSLCSAPPTIDGPIYISFDASYTLYSIQITSDPNGGPYIITRRDVGSADIASLCEQGFDVEAVPDATVIARDWIPEGYGPLGVAMCVRPI